jgi:hypothetical protein
MKRLILTTCLCVLFFAGTTSAHWNPGEPNKWVQLPDPYGWDVRANEPELADDWLCTSTGPVSDIHIWYSIFSDYSLAELQGGVVRIYANNPDGPGGFSQPDGKAQWEWYFSITDSRVSSRWYGEGEQGWFDPRGQEDEDYYLDNHINYYQLNLVDVPDPFEQKEGETYWLALQLNTNWTMGWKTSSDHWGDDAVYSDGIIGGPWQELLDPLTGRSLDMAFVITPEPATICLLGLGTLILLRRKRSA